VFLFTLLSIFVVPAAFAAASVIRTRLEAPPIPAAVAAHAERVALHHPLIDPEVPRSTYPASWLNYVGVGMLLENAAGFALAATAVVFHLNISIAKRRK
jgi:hypothetical protein